MAPEASRVAQVARPFMVAPCPSTSRIYSHGPTPSVARTMSTTVNSRSGVSLARWMG